MADVSTDSTQSKAVEPYDSKKATGQVGLVNMGCTCYMNSLLQLLFHINYFRSAVYKITEDEKTDEATGERAKATIPEALQELFYQMQERRTAPMPKMLFDSFGWTERDLFVQHDIQELAALLRDNLEGKMKGTPAEGAINRLFEGYGESFIETHDKTYTSKTKDVFYDIHLPLGKCKTIYDSMKSLITKDQLVGDNKYKVEEEGKPAVFKDAEKGYRFLKFPPVIFFHLKRFEMDMLSPTLEMKKVNSALEFPSELDLREFENGSLDEATLKRMQSQEGESFTVDSQAIYDLHGVIVHRGSVRSGHYYCYIREFDLESGSFGKWYEFDDDVVREVDEDAAVLNNFGGYRIHTVHGQQQQFPKTHSAYILSYVRRSDAIKLQQPSATNLIKDSIKERLQRLMQEDERRRQVEEYRSKRCSIICVNDDHITEHVNREGWDLLPRNEKHMPGIRFTIEKNRPFHDVYKEIAAASGVSPDEVRLWTWKHQVPDTRSAFRPSKYLPLFDFVDATKLVSDIIGPFMGENNANKPWSLVLYAEKKRLAVPYPVTNATMTDLEDCRPSSTHYTENDPRPMQAIKTGPAHKFDLDDTNPYMQVYLKDIHTIDFITLRVQHKKTLNYQAVFKLSLYSSVTDKEPVYADQQSITLDTNHSVYPLTFEIGAHRGVRAKIVIIQRRLNRTQRPPEPLCLSRFHVHVPAEELPHAQMRISNKPVHSYVAEQQHFIVMIKFYNYKTETLSYMGSLVVDSREPVQNALPGIYALLGIPKEQQADYPLMLFDETKPYAPSEVSLKHGFSTGDNNMMTGNVVVAQLHPSKIPLIYRHPKLENHFNFIEDRVSVALRNLKTPETVALVVQMQKSWKYQTIVNWIGTHLKLDADKLRLYSSKEYAPPVPREEPERSDGNQSLEDMLRLGAGWYSSDIFFEPLDVSLQQLEAMTQLTVRYNDELGSAPGAEINRDLDPTTTVQAVMKMVLDEAGVAFDRDFVLMFIDDHLIQSHVIVGPTTKPLLLKDHAPRHRSLAEVRPAPVLQRGHTLFCVGHVDNRHVHFATLASWGLPALMVLPDDMDIDELEDHMMKTFQVEQKKVVDPGENGVMLQAHILMRFPDRAATAQAYVKNTVSKAHRPVHLVFNHFKPQEKPGSRYVASNDPKLVLEKK